MNVLYWLYKNRINKKGLAPVMMRITIDSKRVNFPTGIEIEKDLWDVTKQRIKGSNNLAQKYNALLLTLTTLAWDCYNDLNKRQEPVTAQIVKQHILSRDTPRHSLLEGFDYYINNLRERVGNDIMS